MELPQTIDEAADAFKGDAKRKGIEYQVIIHPELPRKVLGDQRKVRQAVSNITANAVKHTSKGSVIVEAYVAAYEDNIAYVDVAVQDTGSGMSSKKLDALLMHLEQVQTDTITSPTTRKDLEPEEGDDSGDDANLGLGLAIVARIVRNMNGQLRLKSEEKLGSRFVIQFPFELPKEELTRQHSTSSQKSSSQARNRGPERDEVLLVDRDPDASRSATQSPNRLGRKSSNHSIRSRRSAQGSIASVGSHKSEVDRLIEAIQSTHLVEGKRMSGSNVPQGSISGRPSLEKIRTKTDDATTSSSRSRAKSFDDNGGARSLGPTTPGEEKLFFSVTPLKAIKVPEESGISLPLDGKYNTPGAILGEVKDESSQIKAPEPLNADNLHILVAEDDPVNCKILKKRLERSGHTVYLTINGEECAATYGDREKTFDVVLMDMQVRSLTRCPMTFQLIRARCP
jgi:CheY-like chemotaxis protein